VKRHGHFVLLLSHLNVHVHLLNMYIYLYIAEALFEEDQSEVMPTGRVVGVLQRNWRDYVASFAENEVHLP